MFCLCFGLSLNCQIVYAANVIYGMGLNLHWINLTSKGASGKKKGGLSLSNWEQLHEVYMSLTIIELLNTKAWVSFPGGESSEDSHCGYSWHLEPNVWKY